MFIRRHLFSLILVLGLFTSSTFAQTDAPADNAQAAASATVTATAVAGGGVRFAAPTDALQLRLEIYTPGGERVFDSGARSGSVLDWQPSDMPQGAADGSYLCVVTVKDLRGRARQRLGSLSVQAGQATVQRVREQELSDVQKQAAAASRQAQKSELADADGALTVLRKEKERDITVMAHDGQDGRITSTKGALTLRTGDIFSGNDKEQMRITPGGQVGIGTDKPEATLDVNGTIRARGGIRFDDGTVLTSARGAASSSTAAVAVGDTSSAAALSGTGTTNKLTKWLDGAGTVGDSSIYEEGGLTVFGQSAPLFGGASNFHVVEMVATGTKTPLTLVGGSGSMEFWKDSAVGGFPTRAAAFGMATPGQPITNDMVFSTNTAGQPWAERLRITNAGNVGIGTAAPQSKLEVAGSLRLTGAGSALIFPDGSTMTSAATGGGGGTLSGTSIVNAINDAATSGFIGDNRISANIARLNASNVWASPNLFSAGLSTNGSRITDVGNPVNAGDAVNKAYSDANFIKFVPGAEQLSVGDANGTAPMINLRGGSTCCSGPGGHTPAFFKVFQNGSFVATGNLGIGTSPMEGKGYRTSWHTYKGAFRSGYADNEWDDANVGFFSWAGGSNSTASGLYALAFGDTNSAESTSSIVFGSGNQVKGAAGFSAGAGNRVCDTYGVALGNNARSGGPMINGRCDPETFNIRGLAAVAIGQNVTADQDNTTAMGKFASNNGFTGTFIWSDGAAQATADTFRNTANNEFAARATGGFRFRTNLGGTTGCNLPAGSGVFNCTSSRTTKENFKLASGEDVLARLRKIPVSTWNYTAEGSNVRHMGPMAEDFYQEFGLGTGNTSIGVQDLAGVSLAAVKALDQRTTQLQQRTAEVEQLRSEVQTLRAANASMEQRLAALEQSLQQQQRTTTKAGTTNNTTARRARR
ncbi:MAG TPA: tail fiber domain-containing protein [Pyrinomonadaceae bacterium]|nr:tail fiber domain-containing protein [Pyrinomonadaceae bacterium]